jgi:hypothetical protein
MTKNTENNHQAMALVVALMTTSSLLGGCGKDGSDAIENGNFSAGADGYGSYGGEGDPGGDSGLTGSGDGAGETGDNGGDPVPPPEDEEEGDFRVPETSGKYVYSASEATDRVAAINTDSLAIDVVDVGGGPTEVRAIPGQPVDAGAVAVLDVITEDIALVRTTAQSVTTVELREVTPSANDLRVSDDGAWVLAFHDIDKGALIGPGSDQEVTLISPDSATESTFLTVGLHPRDVAFSPDSTKIFVTTDDGVNVIDLTAPIISGKPILFPVVSDPAIDPATLEVVVAAQSSQAIARVNGDSWLVLTDLNTGAQTTLELPGFPTDLDLGPDGSYALLTVPGQAGSSIIRVPLPAASDTDFEVFPIGEEYVGVAELADSGDAMILYTTQNPWEDSGTEPPLGDPRTRFTIARIGAGNWEDQTTLFTEVGIRAVGIEPSGRSAILLHDEAPEIYPNAPWPYTIVDLSVSFPVKKVQTAEAKPGPVLFTPAGDRAAVSVRSDAAGVRRVDLVNLETFIVDGLNLGSPPQGLSYVELTDKIMISQEHPTGRITFVRGDGEVQTVTGFELSDAVKD